MENNTLFGEAKKRENILSEENVFTVSEYIKILNESLMVFKAKIIGEASEVKIWSSGHVYFSLKDEKNGNVMNCVIWKSRYGILGVNLKDGLKIIASGRPEIYPPSGKISFIADTIELAGEGALKKEYERLKAKLESEGIFAFERKRKIPDYIQKIGIITSKQGAVLADFLNNLAKFNFKVKMIDSRVEGQLAVGDILSAIKTFRKKDIEILVIMRGGGSLEALLAFNNEILVREAANFPVPIIAAIGHDKDVPLLALAADFAVSTPTAAANLLNRPWEQAELSLERYKIDISDKYRNCLEETNGFLRQSSDIAVKFWDLISKKYKDASAKINIFFQRIKDAMANIKSGIEGDWGLVKNGFNQALIKAGWELDNDFRIARDNDPMRQLKLGYSIAMVREKIIKTVEATKVGENIDITLSDGEISSEIKNIIIKNKKNE
ncbi:MAG: exodeoxyribonuclease VII large subunit [Candidatus Nealsonbacteria bacterium RIFCSPHIGHO2_01_FULL_38_55]|uniref:Exodeoxyribonuclease 7 large subunit n=2 Tax=Candidatus Nealsoniibacteriota TaxID=1817911 RepID=A0A1G2EKR3_9BACT|nr:MAG: Exodeoxyribonuclease 7 large subunit [Parcubacteria group bacterium GW2011_GWA2_38_27]KKQ98704.1 MAG: Exodeoxyribonuclease 7 large subunit [Parcubacteria group bacterium GW2011_GWC2_39_11]OGZ19660.1 MAG: exodeoxyribonuclease VII large subunit [Candidatus Nealsonbacteria bacterium RIFCSPHIGHO2_01_FULL_38_55]OGZ20668.1 MAG: exodeoxyribonuclease VII large subunit [Candidatus Nealsonbacteria bacterium RIFCSPHIGHO2_02_38_10]OGZ23147.1 MAG: exodeoxyribonuclease VII large subunit [Candidatus N